MGVKTDDGVKTEEMRVEMTGERVFLISGVRLQWKLYFNLFTVVPWKRNFIVQNVAQACLKKYVSNNYF